MPTHRAFKNRQPQTAMRAFLLLLIALPLALSVRGQDETFTEFHRYLEAAKELVENEATAVAEAERYLREVRPVGDPTALIAGDVQLEIGGVWFVLYLQSANGHTEARLVSQELEVSEAVKREATAFLEEVATRAVSKRG